MKTSDRYTIEQIQLLVQSEEYDVGRPAELSRMKAWLWEQTAKKKNDWLVSKELLKRDKAKQGAEMKAEQEVYTDSKWVEKSKNKYTDNQIKDILDAEYYERKMEVIAKLYELDIYSNLRNDMTQLISSVKMEIENTNLQITETANKDSSDDLPF